MHSRQSKQRIKEGRFFYGHIILAVSFLILMIVYGAQYSFGVFLKPVLTEFGWTRAVTAAAYSINFMSWGLWSILIGRVADRFGPRLVVTVSGLLVSCSYLLMSQITALWQIYLVYGGLLSLGVAGSFVPLLSTIARWFITTRGLASGIVTAGIGVGVIFMPPLANYLITSYSWRTSFMGVGLIALVMPVISQFLKREPTESVMHRNDEPHDTKSILAIRGLSLHQAIRTRQLWLISGMSFILGVCVHTVMVHIVAYATDEGISANIAATILSVVGIVSTVSKVGMGSAIDRFRCKPVWIAVGILMLVSFAILQWSGVLGVLYAFAVSFAVSYAGFAAAQSPTIAEYFGLRAHGTIYGVNLFGTAIGGAIGPYITGLIYDRTGSYNPAFVGCATICILAIILPILLKPTDKTGIVQG
jgi:MFS family permease